MSLITNWRQRAGKTCTTKGNIKLHFHVCILSTEIVNLYIREVIGRQLASEGTFHLTNKGF